MTTDFHSTCLGQTLPVREIGHDGGVKVACLQLPVVFDDPTANVAKASEWIAKATGEGAKLIVLSEAYLSGYCVSTREEAEKIALRVHCAQDLEVTDADPAVYAMLNLAIEHDVHLVFGVAAKDDFGLINCALLAEPNGRLRRYVKTHLPCLGFDQFAEPGQALPVFETELGRIGILICYDLRFPEATRVLALRGAEIVALPTNWPVRKFAPASVMVPARSHENKIYYATCNRLGEENGFSFAGGSGLYDLDGSELARIGNEEGMIIAEVDLALAREKHSVVIPGSFSTHMTNDRRPELYGDLVVPNA